MVKTNKDCCPICKGRGMYPVCLPNGFYYRRCKRKACAEYYDAVQTRLARHEAIRRKENHAEVLQEEQLEIEYSKLPRD